jgi:Tfp pilus assembly protein PilV
MKNILIAGLLLGSGMLALAKLPALSPEAKAKSDEAAAKLAWSTKVDTYQLCQTQDKVAASYYKTAQGAGKQTKPPAATPPCSDPGPFSYTAQQSPKPLETSGAHSPADTAVAPPSSKAVDAVINPDKKP